jgi:hypothetical protein
LLEEKGGWFSTWELAAVDTGGSGRVFLPEEQLGCKQEVNRRHRKQSRQRRGGDLELAKKQIRKD